MDLVILPTSPAIQISPHRRYSTPMSPKPKETFKSAAAQAHQSPPTSQRMVVIKVRRWQLRPGTLPTHRGRLQSRYHPFPRLIRLRKKSEEIEATSRRTSKSFR